jgi:choline kinase
MKAIIIAAGMGSRLGDLTKDLPKCLLELNGKSLLQHQLDALRANGITDISIIKGYKQEKINLPGIKYYLNENYRNNNILNSLMCAEKEMDDDVIIAYSDILYDQQVVKRLMESNKPISIIVDIDWKGYYEGRTDHPIEQAENVILDSNNRVIEIGKIVTNKDDVHGEFIGMMKLSKRGCEVFKKNFNRAKQLFWGKPFQKAATFEKAYVTDMLQDLTDLGVNVHCVIIEKGWMEIDTVQDYERAELMIKNKKHELKN